MKTPTHNHKLSMPPRRRLIGLSLIELMVALVLGIIIVAAVSQLFINISRTNQEMAKTNSQIESARFAMQFLQDDIAHAGFWDGYVPQFDDLSLVGAPVAVTVLGGTPLAIPDPCKPYTEWDDTGDADYVRYRNELLGIPLQVTSGAPGSCGGIVLNQEPGTDVLVVRHAETCEPGVGYCDDTGTVGQLYFQPSFCNLDAEVYSLDTTPTLRDRTCSTASPVPPNLLAPRRRFAQSIYYVRTWANVAPTGPLPQGDGIPTLVRSQFALNGGALAQQPAVALVEGIEGFRVEVGIDNRSEPYVGMLVGTTVNLEAEIDWLDEENWETPTNRGDGIPDGNFVHCPTSGCTATAADGYEMQNVVAAKVYILARANEATPGYTDTKTYTLGGSGDIGPFTSAAKKGFKRHVFSTTIRLNNISGRRETP